MNYDLLRKDIHSDEAQGILSILCEDDQRMEILDIADICSRFYILWNTEYMDKKWFLSRILAVPSVGKRINIDLLAEWTIENVPKEFLFNLNYLIFIDDIETASDWLIGHDPYFSDLLEVHDLPEDSLGIFWYTESIIVINLENIEASMNALVQEDLVFDWEISSFANYEILLTIIHEIRHLAQGNPYISENILNQKTDNETDAEDYAQAFLQDRPLVYCYK